jgi:hypothetical protein
MEQYCPSLLVGVSLKTVGNVADIAVGGTLAVAQVVVVDRTGVVQARGLVDAGRGPLVADLLEVRLVVLGAGLDHGADLGLLLLCQICISHLFDYQKRHETRI